MLNNGFMFDMVRSELEDAVGRKNVSTSKTDQLVFLDLPYVGG